MERLDCARTPSRRGLRLKRSPASSASGSLARTTPFCLFANGSHWHIVHITGTERAPHQRVQGVGLAALKARPSMRSGETSRARRSSAGLSYPAVPSFVSEGGRVFLGPRPPFFILLPNVYPPIRSRPRPRCARPHPRACPRRSAAALPAARRFAKRPRKKTISNLLRMVLIFSIVRLTGTKRRHSKGTKGSVP